MRQGLKSTTASERAQIGIEFGISPSTVSGVFSKLRSFQLIGTTTPISPIIPSNESNSQESTHNQESVASHNQLPSNSQQSVASHTPSIDSNPIDSQEYATREDCELLWEAVTSLASFFEEDEDEEPSARLFQYFIHYNSIKTTYAVAKSANPPSASSS